jgi:hypothetical protein
LNWFKERGDDGTSNFRTSTGVVLTLSRFKIKDEKYNLS